MQQFESYQKQVEEHGLLPRNDLERRQKADAAKRMKHLEDRRIQITKMKEVKREESGKEKPNTPGEVHYQRISTQLKEQVSSGEISVDDIKVKLVETRQSQTKISKAMANTKNKKSEVYMEMKKQISLVRAELRALDELRSNLVSKRTSSRNTVKGSKAKPSALNLEGKRKMEEQQRIAYWEDQERLNEELIRKEKEMQEEKLKKKLLREKLPDIS